MGKIIAYEFLTIDGKFKGPAGQEMDFVQAHFCEAMERDIARQYDDLSAFVMGRTTFDALSRYWPTEAARGELLQDRMNRIRKLVVSSDPDVSRWPNSEHLGEDGIAALAERRNLPDADVMVIGSGTLVRALAARSLIDEFRLLLFPAVLPDGVPLFEPGAAPLGLELIDSRRFATGAVALDYRVDRASSPSPPAG